VTNRQNISLTPAEGDSGSAGGNAANGGGNAPSGGNAVNGGGNAPTGELSASTYTRVAYCA
jgi:hypothetical protein